MRKSNNRIFTIFGIVFILSFVLKLISIVFRDPIIIYFGIRLFRMLSSVSLAIFVISGAGVLCRLTFLVITKVKQERQMLIDKAMDDSGPNLKMAGKLDPVKIKTNLQEKSKNWENDSYTKKIIAMIYKNMDDMDGYQAKLKELLDNNGAEALRDTEDVLNKVEQHICRNVRKLINIMTILDPNNDNDHQMLLTTIQNCIEDNKALLESTKNFMMAVSQFLNSQGEDGETITEVESYKKILTEQIQKGGIYK